MELTFRHVSKHFKDKKAVDDVNLHLQPGIFGLLGANGAGKTTLIRMAAGILKPSDGKIYCDGTDIKVMGAAYRNIFGYLPQTFGFYPEFTVENYLCYMASLKGIDRQATAKRIHVLLECMHLDIVRKKKIRKLSGGMQRRVGIAQALLNKPKILVLDEPTSGLDPGERIRLRNLLSEVSRDCVVLISTHIVSDIESIADRNAIMKNGRIIAEGTTSKLTALMEGRVWSAQIPEDKLMAFEQKMCIVSIHSMAAGSVHIRYLSDTPLLPHSKQEAPGLEDLYLRLFPETLRKEERENVET